MAWCLCACMCVSEWANEWCVLCGIVVVRLIESLARLFAGSFRIQLRLTQFFSICCCCCHWWPSLGTFILLLHHLLLVLFTRVINTIWSGKGSNLLCGNMCVQINCDAHHRYIHCTITNLFFEMCSMINLFINIQQKTYSIVTYVYINVYVFMNVPGCGLWPGPSTFINNLATILYTNRNTNVVYGKTNCVIKSNWIQSKFIYHVQ